MYIAEHKSWTEVGFASFAEFALASTKNKGLGISNIDAAKLLGYRLLKTKQFDLWGELLDIKQRPQGRPKTKLVNDEDKREFYTVSTASTGSDNLIPKLQSKSPDEFAEVCRGEPTLLQAALRARIVKKQKLLCGACSLEKIKKLTLKDQIRLFCDLFATVSLDVQCELLGSEVEPKLKLELPGRWRDAAGEEGLSEQIGKPAEES